MGIKFKNVDMPKYYGQKEATFTEDDCGKINKWLDTYPREPLSKFYRDAILFVLTMVEPTNLGGKEDE